MKDYELFKRTCPRCSKVLPTERGKWSHVKQAHPDWPTVDEILGKGHQ